MLTNIPQYIFQWRELVWMWRSLTLWYIPFQVSFVQYSDEAKSEFKLNTFDDKAQALGALQNIQYRGGNTRTGDSEQ